MSSRTNSRNRLSRFSSTFKHIFFPMSEDEREDSNHVGTGKSLQAGDGKMGDSDEDGDFLRGSKERMRDDIDSNTQLSKENRRMLVRIDERTAWIARLLVGVFMALIGAVYLSGGI